MRQLTACVLGASLLAATGAFAQSSAPVNYGGSNGGLYITGYGELGYFSNTGMDDSIYNIDVDMGLAPRIGANGLGFGFSLGLDAMGQPGSGEYALYPALELGTNIGKFSIGVPRSVRDHGYLPENKFGNNTFVDLRLMPINDSILGTRHFFGDDDVWGLRYDGAFGPTNVGASYHLINTPVGDAEYFALAANHTFAGSSGMVDFMIYGAVEHESRTTSSITPYQVGVEAYWEKATAGLEYASTGGTGATTMVSAYLDYKVTDSLTLTGSLGHLDAATSVVLYGVGVQYDFLQNAYVKASVVDTNVAGNDPFVEVMLGWKF